MSRGDAVNQRNRTRVLPKPDCYDYIRRYYGVPAYVGVRVRVGDRPLDGARGREGVLVEAKHSQHYVHVRLDGDQRSNVYHPTDGVEYLVVRQGPQITDVDDAGPQTSKGV